MSGIEHLKKHLDELRKRVLRSVIVVIAIIVFLMMFHAEELAINEYVIYYPVYAPLDNIAAQITNMLRDDLVPDTVQLIQTAPGQAFFAQVYVAALVGVIVGIPVIVREAVMFMRPALRENEINISRSILVPAVALFIIGCIFAYMLVIPYTLDFLYKYGQSSGLITYLNVSDFVLVIIQFLISFGLSFQLPLFMYALSVTKIVDSGYWLQNARIGVFIIIIFGAVITPDGSGVTMWFIALPMIALYFAGVVIIRHLESKESP